MKHIFKYLQKKLNIRLTTTFNYLNTNNINT